MGIGTEGAMLIAGRMPVLLPEEKFRSYPRPKLEPRNHYHHFAQTGPMTEAILLGTVAIRVPNETLKWGSANLKVTHSTTA